MYQGLQFPLCLSPPLTLNRNQKIWKQILSSLYMYYLPKTKIQLFGTKQVVVSIYL